MRFVILLWGDKSSLLSDGVQGIPVFNYKEIINFGQESRRAISTSHDVSKSIGLYNLFLRIHITVTLFILFGVIGNLSLIELFGFTFTRPAFSYN